MRIREDVFYVVYPFVIKSGAIIEWWQVKWAADFGFWLAIPAIVSTFYIGLNSIWGQLVFWASLAVWVGIIYSLLGKLFKVFQSHRAGS